MVTCLELSPFALVFLVVVHLAKIGVNDTVRLYSHGCS